MPRLETTVIGSLPRLKPDLADSVRSAVELQRRYGIDIVSDGEQRADMIAYFADSVPGLGNEGGLPTITGKICTYPEPAEFPKVLDFDRARTLFPDLRIKMTVTGPVTLGLSCGSRGTGGAYRNIMDPQLYEDLGDVLTPIVEELSRRGALVQIDEPFLSQGLRDYPAKLAIIDRIMASVPYEQASIHVCGFLGRHKVLDHLLGLEHVQTLSHAFSSGQEKDNIGLLDGRKLADAGKKLGAGCVTVSPYYPSDLDPPEKVAERLKSIIARVGPELVRYAHPDCGMRATKMDFVEPILARLQASVEALAKP